MQWGLQPIFSKRSRFEGNGQIARAAGGKACFDIVLEKEGTGMQVLATAIEQGGKNPVAFLDFDFPILADV
ncbi:uncharacterized protein VTP21DRAFT_7264 [Calcarisporiella thermophila]|uniref:uncharacterized protein n=1 Tax=Calcarisporiella thermophila TaxID=911321 RepID=UPI00374262B8